MKIQLISQNVRGLNDPLAIDNLRQYLHTHPVDFLFIQEHKLRGAAVENMGRKIWKRATTLFTHTEPGYNTDGSHAGKGGVASFIAPQWKNHVSSSGTIFGGRVLWFILSKLSGGDLGFINLYALVESHARKVLWETMTRELPNSCRWILLGDFNMVEKRSDKSSSSGRSILAHERRLFNTLKDTLQVQEDPLTSPSLLFSWDNARIGNDRVMARLDRVYIFSDTNTSHKKLLEYRIRGDHSRSDHNLVSIILELVKPLFAPADGLRLRNTSKMLTTALEQPGSRLLQMPPFLLN